MITHEEARARILESVSKLEPRSFDRLDALGLVLADDVDSNEDVPPFANTAMDGYAVRAADTRGASEDSPARLRVVGELAAGYAPSTAVGSGEAIRIMTGAPVPEGADAIVMVERTATDDDHVLVMREAESGDHIRPTGGDLRAGQRVFDAGTVLGPASVGVLASLDVARVSAYPRARVGVMSTGDELVESGPLAAGQIRDSNRPMLLSLVADAGCEPVDLGVARDDEQYIVSTIEAGLETCDAILTSGGVSMGEYDFVKLGLRRLSAERPGVEFQWWQVKIKPAKPLVFGTLEGKPVFGLPGNPVSSSVSFELFARPALRTMMGHRDPLRPVVVAVADHAMPRRADGKVYLERVRVRYEDGRFHASRSGDQSSNVLSAMAAANGLTLIPDGEGVPAGGDLPVMLLT
ncbi:MAG: molybdopterin molybdotransferase MoeA [Acidimicrobiia bacterium]|nr:molybdopterin molybdotransferase MoeA [Acidimicrobiia bacterium]